MVDFRKGHDGLAALVKNELRKDPFTGVNGGAILGHGSDGIVLSRAA